MAELIPVNYKLRVAQKEHVGHWITCGILAVIVCAGALAYTYMWRRQQAVAHEIIQVQYQDKASLMLKAEEMQARRAELASRMQQVQHLMDDKMLLSLLRNVSEGFGPLDCLEDVSIEARAAKPAGDKPGVHQSPYLVHVTGITANSSTLAELMTRLSRRNLAGAQTSMNVVLEASHREKLLDGQVMRFQILCHETPEKGS
jgi:hypothetical protein